MSPKNFHRLFAAALLTLPPAAAVAADPWQVTAEAASQVKAFKRTSVIVADVLIYDMRNWMVCGGTEQERTPLLGLHDLLACFHITHPASSLEVKFRDGIQIAMDDVQFAKGKWDAAVRLTQHEVLEVDAQEKYLLLDLVRVGVNDLQGVRHKIGVIRLMAKACLPEEAPAPKAKSSGG